MISQRAQAYALAGLLVLLAAIVYYSFFDKIPSTGFAGVLAADTKFEPLDVQEAQLRLDKLEKLRKLEYSGSHRNIFVVAPPPPPASQAQAAANAAARFVGPMPPPPPPPLQIPAEFFGYATQPRTGRRTAFFTSGDDVLVVSEGDKFLNNLRLVHIGNDSADVEEISSGRHATVQMVQPPAAQTP
jgi:hypothetical protein